MEINIKLQNNNFKKNEIFGDLNLNQLNKK